MTSGEISKAIADLNDSSQWTRANAADQLREAGKPAFSALIAALDSPSSLQRKEAAHIIRLIADDLASRPILEQGVEYRRLPAEIRELVAALESPDYLWRETVEAELIKRQGQAFDVLIDLLNSKHTTRTDRIIRLLGEWGDLRAVSHLLQAWETLGSDTYMVIVEALAYLAKAAAQRPLELSHDEMLLFLNFARQELGKAGAPLGDALCVIAQQRPTRELREFLPYLKGKWLNPVPESFEKARLAILAATKDLAELPLPAEETGDTLDLPKPAAPISDGTDLPTPVERN